MKRLVQTVILGLILVGCKTASQIAPDSDLPTKTISGYSEGITEKYWKLIELNGKPVVLDNQTGGRGAFLILRKENNRVNGSTGCNTLTGTFEIDPARYRIRFSQMATSLAACLNMEVENELKRVLDLVDNYSTSADGKHLSLNRARMAPLVRFEAVYLQ